MSRHGCGHVQPSSAKRLRRTSASPASLRPLMEFTDFPARDPLLFFAGELSKTAQDFIELEPVEIFSIGKDGPDLLGVFDGQERIFIEQKEIRDFAFFDRSEGIKPARAFRGMDGGGSKRFHGSEPALDELIQFIVKAEALIDKGHGPRIRSGQHFHSRFVHGGDDGPGF
jgi:hypothetical protein